MHREAVNDAEPGDDPSAADVRERERAHGVVLSQETRLIAMLRHQAEVRDDDLAVLRRRLASAEEELLDLRAIRDALTPPELPQRPGLEIAATFLPADENVGGDFYLVAAGPGEATVLVIGDVVGHGLIAARRAAFVRTVFSSTAPFSDDPVQLLSWVNAALIERAGTSADYVTVACATYLPGARLLRWAYAGHPPALSLDDGSELVAPKQGAPLGPYPDLGCIEGSHHVPDGAGLLLYTDGLTEARHDDGSMFGLESASATLAGLCGSTAAHAVAAMRARVTAFASSGLADDLCLLAARVG